MKKYSFICGASPLFMHRGVLRPPFFRERNRINRLRLLFENRLQESFAAFPCDALERPHFRTSRGRSWGGMGLIENRSHQLRGRP